MLHYISDLIKWVIFTDEERTVLLEAFNTFFPVPKLAPPLTPAPEDEDEDYSARRDLQTDELKLESLRSIRSLLLASLPRGPNAVLSLSALDCEALSALVMLEIAGFYDYLMRVEASFATLGFKLGPINDDRQTVRFRIFNKLNTWFEEGILTLGAALEEAASLLQGMKTKWLEDSFQSLPQDLS